MSCVCVLEMTWNDSISSACETQGPHLASPLPSLLPGSSSEDESGLVCWPKGLTGGCSEACFTPWRGQGGFCGNLWGRGDWPWRVALVAVGHDWVMAPSPGMRTGSLRQAQPGLAGRGRDAPPPSTQLRGGFSYPRGRSCCLAEGQCFPGGGEGGCSQPGDLCT